MFVVGLTGGIGSGKSTVAALFSDLEVPVFDADSYSREVVEPGSEALKSIVERFGDGILDPAGELDRARLREIVFQDSSQRSWLEQLLHPLINARIRDDLSSCTTPYCILESPLLLETSQREMVDRVLVVDVSREIQLQRALSRDGSDQAVIEAMIESQMDRQQRLQRADDVINNEAETALLEERVKQLHEHYLKLAQLDEQEH